MESYSTPNLRSRCTRARRLSWIFFKGEKGITKAVIELKDAKTPLDKKQSGREKGYTPIEQAYSYASKFDRCNWATTVSNFREIRLYSNRRSQGFYERFDVLKD